MSHTFVCKVVVERREEEEVRIPLTGQLARNRRLNWSATELGRDSSGNEWALVDVEVPDQRLGELTRGPDSRHLGKGLSRAAIVTKVQQALGLSINKLVAEHTGRSAIRRPLRKEV